MIIDNNPIEMAALEAALRGDKEEAARCQAEFIRQFYENFKEPGSHCSCTEACKWHGKCKECVTLHRAHGDHLPECLKNIK